MGLDPLKIHIRHRGAEDTVKGATAQNKTDGVRKPLRWRPLDPRPMSCTPSVADRRGRAQLQAPLPTRLLIEFGAARADGHHAIAGHGFGARVLIVGVDSASGADESATPSAAPLSFFLGLHVNLRVRYLRADMAQPGGATGRVAGATSGVAA